MAQLTRLVAVLAVGAVALVGGGCGDDDDTAGTDTQDQSAAAEGVFVGTVEGTDAYIALISDGTTLRGGYLCDGEDVSVWLAPADLNGDQVALASRQDAELGTATWSGTRVSGTVAVDGAEYDFSAALATGDAGLYREAVGTFAQAGYEETGWIVLPDGSLRGRTGYINPTSDLKTGTKAAPSSVSGDPLDTSFIDPTHDL